MNFYTETDYQGMLWGRDTQDNVFPASTMLSSVYLKYSRIEPNFYYDLVNNNIKRFDSFYDTFFIQTSSGYSFEKYKIDNSIIKPQNKLNNLQLNQSDCNIDYWFNETEKKIYVFEFINPDVPFIYPNGDVAAINFAFAFKCYDLKTTEIKLLLQKNVVFYIDSAVGMVSSNGIKEHPKLTYNSDTNLYNTSFIIRNEVKNFGLISINFNLKDIKEINTFIPFGKNGQPLTYVPPSTPTPTPSVTPTSVTPTPTPTKLPPTPTPTPTPTRQAVKSLFVAF
jgi:hypothetical protein